MVFQKYYHYKHVLFRVTILSPGKPFKRIHVYSVCFYWYVMKTLRHCVMKICSPAIYSKDLDATHFPTITKSDVRRVVKSNHEGHVCAQEADGCNSEWRQAVCLICIWRKVLCYIPKYNNSFCFYPNKIKIARIYFD